MSYIVIFSKLLVNYVQIISNVCNIYTFVHDGNQVTFANEIIQEQSAPRGEV